MIWIIALIIALAVLEFVFLKLPSIKQWHEEKRDQRLRLWIIEHKDELPIDPTVINAGEWVKIEENTIAPENGIYLFICRGDNHLLYEVHELLRGTELLWHFQEERTHWNGCFIVKPIYFYYIPFYRHPVGL